MPREVTLFTDDGQWAAAAAAWTADYVLYHQAGVRVRVYRSAAFGVPGANKHGPWWKTLGPWSRGPWNMDGPWGKWWPWRHYGDGPWAFDPRARLGILPAPWVETRAHSIVIEARFSGADGGEVRRRVTAGSASFLRLSESGFGSRLVLRDDERRAVPVAAISSKVEVTVASGVTLQGHVTTAPERARA